MYTKFFSPDLDPIFETMIFQPAPDTLCGQLNDLALSSMTDPAAQIEGAVRPVKEQFHRVLIRVCHQCSVHRATSLI